jgi:hypothetical protein
MRISKVILVVLVSGGILVDAADVIITACANCPNKYRETPTLADGCK